MVDTPTRSRSRPEPEEAEVKKFRHAPGRARRTKVTAVMGDGMPELRIKTQPASDTKQPFLVLEQNNMRVLFPIEYLTDVIDAMEEEGSTAEVDELFQDYENAKKDDGERAKAAGPTPPAPPSV